MQDIIKAMLVLAEEIGKESVGAVRNDIADTLHKICCAMFEAADRLEADTPKDIMGGFELCTFVGDPPPKYGSWSDWCTSQKRPAFF